VLVVKLCGNLYTEGDWVDTSDPCTQERGHEGDHQGRGGMRWADREGAFPMLPPGPSLAIEVVPSGAHFHVRVRCGLPGQRALLGTLVASAEDLALLRAAIPGSS
jgi:hypothetical protein